jgi:hypothetical protein
MLFLFPPWVAPKNFFGDTAVVRGDRGVISLTANRNINTCMYFFILIYTMHTVSNLCMPQINPNGRARRPQVQEQVLTAQEQRYLDRIVAKAIPRVYSNVM